jgi:hypothetical protein
MAKSYVRYSDPGHSWLRVPVVEIEPIKDKISPYSYMRGKFVYLEEDCDMRLFLEHKFGEGYSCQELVEKEIIKEVYVKNTSIRNFEPYQIYTEEQKELAKEVIKFLLSMNFKRSAKARIKKASYDDCVYWIKYYNIQ